MTKLQIKKKKKGRVSPFIFSQQSYRFADRILKLSLIHASLISKFVYLGKKYIVQFFLTFILELKTHPDRQLPIGIFVILFKHTKLHRSPGGGEKFQTLYTSVITSQEIIATSLWNVSHDAFTPFKDLLLWINRFPSAAENTPGQTTTDWE